MTNKNTSFILGWIFLISSFFDSFEINVICACIFFSANFIIDEMQKLAKKENKICG